MKKENNLPTYEIRSLCNTLLINGCFSVTTDNHAGFQTKKFVECLLEMY